MPPRYYFFCLFFYKDRPIKKAPKIIGKILLIAPVISCASINKIETTRVLTTIKIISLIKGSFRNSFIITA